MLLECEEQVDGLRPFEEISRVVKQACQIKKDDPAKYYKALKKIGKGSFGTIFKVKRLSDGRMFALKRTDP